MNSLPIALEIRWDNHRSMWSMSHHYRFSNEPTQLVIHLWSVFEKEALTFSRNLKKKCFHVECEWIFNLRKILSINKQWVNGVTRLQLPRKVVNFNLILKANRFYRGKKRFERKRKSLQRRGRPHPSLARFGRGDSDLLRCSRTQDHHIEINCNSSAIRTTPTNPILSWKMLTMLHTDARYPSILVSCWSTDWTGWNALRKSIYNIKGADEPIESNRIEWSSKMY